MADDDQIPAWALGVHILLIYAFVLIAGPYKFGVRMGWCKRRDINPVIEWITSIGKR